MIWYQGCNRYDTNPISQDTLYIGNSSFKSVKGYTLLITSYEELNITENELIRTNLSSGQNPNVFI